MQLLKMPTWTTRKANCNCSIRKQRLQYMVRSVGGGSRGFSCCWRCLLVATGVGAAAVACVALACCSTACTSPGQGDTRAAPLAATAFLETDLFSSAAANRKENNGQDTTIKFFLHDVLIALPQPESAAPLLTRIKLGRGRGRPGPVFIQVGGPACSVFPDSTVYSANHWGKAFLAGLALPALRLPELPPRLSKLSGKHKKPDSIAIAGWESISETRLVTITLWLCRQTCIHDV